METFNERGGYAAIVQTVWTPVGGDGESDVMVIFRYADDTRNTGLKSGVHSTS